MGTWGRCVQLRLTHIGAGSRMSPSSNARHVGIGALNGRVVQFGAVRTPSRCGTYTQVPGVLSGHCGDRGDRGGGGGASVCNPYPPILRPQTRLPRVWCGPCGDGLTCSKNGEVVCGLQFPTLRRLHPSPPCPSGHTAALWAGGAPVCNLDPRTWRRVHPNHPRLVWAMCSRGR